MPRAGAHRGATTRSADPLPQGMSRFRRRGGTTARFGPPSVAPERGAGLKNLFRRIYFYPIFLAVEHLPMHLRRFAVSRG